MNWAFVASSQAPAAAQDTGNTSSVIEAIKPALEQAARDGATVIVVGNPSDQAKSAGAANEPGLAVTLNRAMFRLRVTVANAGEALGNMSTTLSAASPDGKINWLFYSLLAGIVSIVLGRVMVRPVTNWIRDHLPRKPSA